MFELLVKCETETIKLSTTVEAVYDYFLSVDPFIADTIPGYQAQSLRSDRNVKFGGELLVVGTGCKQCVFETDGNRAFVSCPEIDLYFPDLVYLALAMLGKLLGSYQKFFTHCSVVKQPDGSGILFAGEAGSGKTSIAIKLASHHGYSLVSNDRALVGLKDDMPFVYAGTVQTYIKTKTLNDLFPEVSSGLLQPRTTLSYEDEISLNSVFDKLSITVSDSCLLRRVFFISMVRGCPHGTIRAVSVDNNGYWLTRRLLAATGEYLRAYRNIVLALGVPFPSFDDTFLSTKRTCLVNKILDNCSFFEARGNIEDLVEYILSINE